IVAWIVQNSSSDGTTLPSGRGALRLTSRGGHRLVHEVPQPRHDLVEVRPRRLLGEHLGGVVHRHHLARRPVDLELHRVGHGPFGVLFVAAAEGVDYRRGYEEQDRKSTRLNSSHVKISYAVFCLKKKKKSNEPRGQGTG